MKSHITVLTDEATEALAINETSIVVDATFGSGGHAQEIVARLGACGIFVGIDADETAILDGREMLASSVATTHLVHGNFRNIDSILQQLGIEKVHAILADLGWRMEQFSGNGKGFSFQVDEPLIMTYGNPVEYPFTAHDIVNEWEEEHIVDILRGYGEERFAGRIARHIVEAREEGAIVTTFQLVTIIQNAVPAFYNRARIHSATRTFQALRIAVNDEFRALEEFLIKSVDLLLPQGRLAVITFHSTEDRIVKHFFKNRVHDHVGVVSTKKPISASTLELQHNPRARSAKLRIFEKI